MLSGFWRYQAQLRRMRSRARAGWPAAKWAWISKVEVKGEKAPPISGVAAPIGVQFLIRFSEIREERAGSVIS